MGSDADQALVSVLELQTRLWQSIAATVHAHKGCWAVAACRQFNPFLANFISSFYFSKTLISSGLR